MIQEQTEISGRGIKMARMIEITDFGAPELDVYARLTENQLINRHEPEKGMFIAESPKVIERALDAGYMPVSILTEKRHIEGEGQKILARCGEIPVYTAEFDVLTKLTGFQLTRGMLCAMYRQPLPSVQSVCKGAKRIAVLENVVNPTNVGAIFRSAAALGMDAVQQSILQESNPCEYGDCVSGAVDISWRGDKTGDSEKAGVGRRERAGNRDRMESGAGRESRFRELAEAAS